MPFDGVWFDGDGPLSDVDSFLEQGQLFSFCGVFADVVIPARGSPQPLVIIGSGVQRAFDDGQRLFILVGVFAEREQRISFVKRIDRLPGARFWLRLNNNNQNADCDDRKNCSVHRAKANNSIPLRQVTFDQFAPH